MKFPEKYLMYGGLISPEGGKVKTCGGSFLIPVKRKGFLSRLCVIASMREGWDHVSVSVYNEKRCPTWEEMCTVKRLFFDPEETVVQYHPPESQYVNVHPYCLHLWRKQGYEYPLPDKILIG